MMTKSTRKEEEDMENETSVQTLFPTRKPFDGSAAVRAPEVCEEYTGLSHCFTHVKQPTSCAAELRPRGFGKI